MYSTTRPLMLYDNGYQAVRSDCYTRTDADSRSPARQLATSVETQRVDGFAPLSREQDAQECSSSYTYVVQRHRHRNTWPQCHPFSCFSLLGVGYRVFFTEIWFGFRRRGVFSTEILTGILFHRKWTSHLPKLVFVLPKFTAKIAELDIFSAENVF